MTSFGPVTGDVIGNVQFNRGKVTFENGFNLMGSGDVWHVDGSLATGNANGRDWENAMTTIQAAIDAASAYDIILVKPKLMTDMTGDPTSYAEVLIIPVELRSLSIIGVSTGRTQGGLPQIKMGSGSNALLTIRASGVLIENMGFNGVSSTGGGILLDDDNSAKTAFGTSILNCHFKNCVGSAANATAGGAIQWAAAGNAWQVLISRCNFYKNVCDICVLGTSNTVPQDVVIEYCNFSNSAASTDCNIYAGGSGFGGGLKIDNCIFGKVPALGTTDLFTEITCYGTGGTGVMSNCRFGAAGTITGYGASKASASIGTTIELCANYSNAGLIVREA